MSRDPWPPRIKKYCSECLCTVWMLLAERDGRHAYICVGNPRNGKTGCGHHFEFRDTLSGRLEAEQEQP